MKQSLRDTRGLAAAGCLATLVTAAGTACSPALEDAADAPGRPSIGKINGVTITDSADIVGIAWVNQGCTGTVLSDRWVITARHCNPSPYLRGSTVSFGINTPSYTVMRSVQHPTADVALLRLSTPIRHDRFKNGLYNGDTAALANRLVTCYGRGPDAAGGAQGTLRSTLRQIDKVESIPKWGEVVRMKDDVTFGGDSGGPCFIDNDGESQLTGVLMGGVGYASAGAFRDWAWAVMTGDVGGEEALLTVDDVYRGQSTILDVDRQYARPEFMFLPPISATSLRTGGSVMVRLFESNDLLGTPAVLSSDHPNLTFSDAGNWNDRARSVWVVPDGDCSSTRVPLPDEVIVWEHIEYGGACDVLNPGSIDDVAALRVGGGISSIKLGSNVRARIYAQEGFLGAGFGDFGTTAARGFPGLAGWNDQIRSLRINGTACAPPGETEVVVWDDGDFKGACRTLAVGTYLNPAELNFTNDHASSVQVGTLVRFGAYDDDGLRGQELHLRTDHPFLPALDFNDKMSSARVERHDSCGDPPPFSVILYEDINFTGKCEELPVGEYAAPLTTDFEIGNDTVSSIRLGAMVRDVVIYEDDQFDKPSAPITADVADMTQFLRPGDLNNPTRNWNDQAGSISVRSR